MIYDEEDIEGNISLLFCYKVNTYVLQTTLLPLHYYYKLFFFHSKKKYQNKCMQYQLKKVKRSSFLGGAFESFRRSLATINEDLKGNRDDDVDIQKLSLNGGAKADSGV